MPSYKFRDGDNMVSVSVSVSPAVIDYNDILAAVEVEPDDWYMAPWENCDGYAHHVVECGEFDREAAGAFYNRGYKLIVLDEDTSDVYEWHRARGASKQVAREMEYMARRRLIAQLREWYRDGWQWWQVTCDYHGASAGIGGVDDYDYAYNEVRHDVAGEVAYELEKEGYTVANRPEPRKFYRAGGRNMTMDAWKDHYRRNLNAQNWGD